MSYRISYGRNMQMIKLRPKIKRRSNNRMAVIMIVCFLMVAALSCSQVRRFLLPGNKQVTEAALDQLVDDLKSGEPIYDSVVVFCREILEYA